MQSTRLLFTMCFLMGMAACRPASGGMEGDIKSAVEEIYSTGVTEEGVPYNITTEVRKLSDSEITAWNSMDFTKESVGTSLSKRQGPGSGSGGHCNQWYSDKYCYCSGEISNRGDSYWGSMEHCEIHAIDRGGTGIYGHSESHTIKWLPTVKIEYKITNFCGWTYEVTMGMCGTPFLDLIDWCQWTWMTQKGGMYKLNDCVQYSFDVNAR